MGYLNEFPHVEPNKLNLDWLLEQYATFDEKLNEIKERFEEAVAQFETDLNEYKVSIDEAISNLENNIDVKFEDFTGEVRNEIDSIKTDLVTYLRENMSEWQLEAMKDPDTEQVIIGTRDPETELTDGGALDEIIINNTSYILGGFKYKGRFSAAEVAAMTELETGHVYEIMALNYGHGVQTWIGRPDMGIEIKSLPLNIEQIFSISDHEVVSTVATYPETGLPTGRATGQIQGNSTEVLTPKGTLATAAISSNIINITAIKPIYIYYRKIV